MEIEFWQQRWELDQTAFHLPTVNPHLISFLEKFNISPSSQIFIPLCGKSLDITWLASHNYSVIGIECSNKAIVNFFQEQNIESETRNDSKFISHQAKNIQLLQGDFFDLDKTLLKDVSLLYDRASLIALPSDKRKQYVNLLNRILPAISQILLITLEYDQNIMSGPPFSVSNNEVKALYQDKYNIQMLYEDDVIEGHQKFKERGLGSLLERVYKLSLKK
ncbi:MAG: thiopurine S-methyltransferase [Gammaproteobacteria bacterium]|nr:thiopurine S-methyltransferase [Gammaproteobacteria bacterium]